jgi:hypothetical protein
MPRAAEDLEEVRKFLCPAAREMSEGGVEYLHLPDLKLPNGMVEDALLRLTVTGDGYATRLYLTTKIEKPGLNWTAHRILDREWFTWSFKDVPAEERLSVILVNHFRPLT